MNLVDKIALDCGVKVGKPYIDRLFMPLKNHDFIIFDTRSKYSHGTYDYFGDVYDIIRAYLKQNNIETFQIANENSPRLPCDKCFVTINKKQEAYLISKAKLIISNENYSLYFASILNTKSIGLYSINNPKNTQPIWNRDSQIVLESSRDDNLPSYGQLAESPKTVNLIDPYQIARNILNTLNIKNDLDKFELVHLGKNFNQRIIEVIPDFTASAEVLKGASINLRLDYIDDLNQNVFYYWLNNRKVNILTNKNLNIKSLLPFKNNIIMVTVIMSDNIDEAFLKQCKQNGFRVRLHCREPEKIKDYQYKFFDWNIEKDFKTELKLKDFSNINGKSFFISSKVLISKGKQFSCRANQLQNKFLDKTQETVIFSETFEEELDYFKIYNEREESSFNSSTA